MTRPQGAGLDAPAFAYVSTELDAMAAADNYRRGIMRYFAPYLGRRIIEVGAGMGAFSRSLLRNAQSDELVLVEPADNLAPRLARDFAGDPRVTVVHGYLDRLHGRPPVDSVILVNVLEHIRNDAGALRAIRDLLLPRGTLLLFVPAWPFLYGSMDRAFGHLRRYTKPVLAGLLAEAGYEIVQLRYFNSAGIPHLSGWG